MKKKVMVLLVLLVVLFAWGNSLLPVAPSDALSTWFTSLIGGGSGWLTVAHVRKLAHAAEFFLLGVFLTVLLASGPAQKRRGRIPTVLLLGLLTALSDETIQLFNDRGPSVADVWIDVAGFMLGFGLTYLILILMTREKKNCEHKD